MWVRTLEDLLEFFELGNKIKAWFLYCYQTILLFVSSFISPRDIFTTFHGKTEPKGGGRIVYMLGSPFSI